MPTWTNCLQLQSFYQIAIQAWRWPEDKWMISKQFLGDSCGLSRGASLGWRASHGRGVCCASDWGAGRSRQGASLPAGCFLTGLVKIDKKNIFNWDYMKTQLKITRFWKVTPHLGEHPCWTKCWKSRLCCIHNGGKDWGTDLVKENVLLIIFVSFQTGAKIAIATTNLTARLLGIE